MTARPEGVGGLGVPPGTHLIADSARLPNPLPTDPNDMGEQGTRVGDAEDTQPASATDYPRREGRGGGVPNATRRTSHEIMGGSADPARRLESWRKADSLTLTPIRTEHRALGPPCWAARQSGPKFPTTVPVPAAVPVPALAPLPRGRVEGKGCAWQPVGGKKRRGHAMRHEARDAASRVLPARQNKLSNCYFYRRPPWPTTAFVDGEPRLQ